MAAIGLGKREGAAAIHGLGPVGLRTIMPRAARMVAARFVLGGVAVVENEFGEPSAVAALVADEIAGPREMELLERARSHLPRLPFDDLDVLLIDRIGKDVSGTGVDPNVVGRWMVAGLPEPDPPRVRIIVARSLTPASGGNALGVGLVDFVTSELAARVDLAKTYVNGLTAGWSGLWRTRLPPVLATDREAVTVALATCGRPPGEPLRLLWITDTLDLRVAAASPALWAEAEADERLDLVGPPFGLPFGDRAELPPLAHLATATDRAASLQS
jgi:hypothetical protein